jgi:hypothetical protein
MRQGSHLVGGLGCVVALLLAPAAATASNLTVTNTDNAGAGSLRRAIGAANASGGTDTITITVTGIVTLTSALPVIGGGTTIVGPATDQFGVDGAHTFQVFKVTSGNVSISKLTILHGECDAACGSTGGGLFNASGTVTLNQVAIGANDTPGQGGGIYNTDTGTVHITDSAVNGNTAADTGGTNGFPEGAGIWNDGTMTIVRSAVSNNTASATGASGQNAPEGAGIYNNTNGTLTLDRTTMDANLSIADANGSGGTTNAVGGAIVNDGTVNILRSTLSHNTAHGLNGTSNAGRGGGMANAVNAEVTVDRSTISDNTATGADVSSAGGLEVDGMPFSITSSTIVHNTAASGANLAVEDGSTLKNSIVSNPAGGGGDCSTGANLTSAGYNLADDATCHLLAFSDKPSTDPMLAASLGDNGGPTQTYALLPGSPAIDGGQGSTGEAVDQRGITRPSDLASTNNAPGGDGTDIGAFELSDPNAILDSGPTGTIDDPTPNFGFHASDGASALQCRIDGGAFSPCASPKTTTHLADGSHTFQVRGKDALGNLDPTPASRSFTVKTASVRRSGSTLVVTAAPAAKDNLKISRPSPTVLRVTDLPAAVFPGSGVHTGTGCSRSGDYTANCNAGPITAIKLTSGAGIDRVRNTTAVPSSLNGGAADDALIGGAANDTLTGGVGVDTFQGGKGDDKLLARDMASDSVIDCDGPGGNPGAADEAIVDALPKDPNSIVHGCETVTRP